MPSAAAGAFHRRVTPPLPLLIATNPTGASYAESAVDSLSLGDGFASADSETDSFGIGAPESSLSLFVRAKIARRTIPAITIKRTVGELVFFAGAEVETLLLGAGVVDTDVVERLGTGGISIFVASTFDADAEIFFTGRFVAAFFTGRLTLFFVARAGLFRVAGFFAGRLGATFLAGRFAGAFFLAATNLSFNQFNEQQR